MRVVPTIQRDNSSSGEGGMVQTTEEECYLRPPTLGKTAQGE